MVARTRTWTRRELVAVMACLHQPRGVHWLLQSGDELERRSGVQSGCLTCRRSQVDRAVRGAMPRRPLHRPLHCKAWHLGASQLKEEIPMRIGRRGAEGERGRRRVVVLPVSLELSQLLQHAVKVFLLEQVLAEGRVCVGQVASGAPASRRGRGLMDVLEPLNLDLDITASRRLDGDSDAPVRKRLGARELLIPLAKAQYRKAT